MALHLLLVVQFVACSAVQPSCRVDWATQVFYVEAYTCPVHREQGYVQQFRPCSHLFGLDKLVTAATQLLLLLRWLFVQSASPSRVGVQGCMSVWCLLMMMLAC